MTAEPGDETAEGSPDVGVEKSTVPPTNPPRSPRRAGPDFVYNTPPDASSPPGARGGVEPRRGVEQRSSGPFGSPPHDALYHYPAPTWQERGPESVIPRAHPRRRGRLLGLALATILIVVPAIVIFTRPTLDVAPPSSSDPQDPTRAPAPTTPVPPVVAGAPAIPHGSGGEFLSSAYAEGAHELRIDARDSSELLGSSADGAVVGVLVDDEVRGIDTSTTEVKWSYPSYACSEGAWRGIVLCVDSAEPDLDTEAVVTDIVGLELSTGEVAFRFDPEQAPGPMTFIGSDDAHGYFTMALRGEQEGRPDAQSVLALNPDGALAWLTPLEGGGQMEQTALVDNDRIAVSLGETVLLLERSTGAVTVSARVGEAEGFLTVDLLWDGWLTYMSDPERTYWLYDQSGNLTMKSRYMNGFVPSSRTVGTAVVPVYSREALTEGSHGQWTGGG